MARVHWNPEWIGILGHLREMVSLSPESLASCWTKNHQHGPPATLDDKGDQPGTEDLLLMRAGRRQAGCEEVWVWVSLTPGATLCKRSGSGTIEWGGGRLGTGLLQLPGGLQGNQLHLPE